MRTNHRFVTAFAPVLLFCGHILERKKKARFRRSSHAAGSKVVPLICPQCKAHTYAPVGTIRRG